MAWTRPTLGEIVDRIEKDIESRLVGSVSLLAKAVLKVLARVFAGAIHIVYGFVEEVSKQLMIDKADTDWLERHAFIWGVNRKAASFAVGNVTFTGENGTIIPAGTVLQTSTGIEYATTEEGVIADGFSYLAIQAMEAGTAGNLTEATTLELVSPIVGVDNIVYIGIYDIYYDNLVGGSFAVGDELSNTTRSGTALVIYIDTGVVAVIIIEGEFRNNDSFNNGSGVSADVDGTPANLNFLTGGEEAETDEDLRDRILERIQQQPAGGCAHDYIRWSKEVSGVDDAWVLPATPSPGWVTVIIKAIGSNPVPSPALLAEIVAYLDERKPVSADVNVVAVDPVEIEFGISIDPNTTDYQTLITDNLTQMFEETVVPGEDVLLSRINNAISTTGINDFEITSIMRDGVPVSIADISLTGYEYAVLEDITFAAL